ncbi:hypothetical protein MCEMSEM23_00987 [Rhabdaerophilaceae bacterium]
MLRSILALIILAAASHANGQTSPPEQERWLCVTDAATGFSFDLESKRWRATHFRSEDKWIIRRPDENDISRLKRMRQAKTPQWIVAHFGGGQTGGFCSDDFREDELTCGIFFGQLKFNRKLLRFITTVDFGYVTPVEIEGTDTPYMQIGRCSAF